MRLFQAGELRLLTKVRKRFSLDSKDKGVIVGIGDDAAVIAPHHNKTIITTDMMNEGVHFDLGYTSPFHLGFKLVSVNVSDVMAMGGVPKHIFLNLAFTSDADEELFTGIYDGIEAALKLYGVQLLGGDLCASRNDIVVSATLVGEGEKIITRSGAAPGDKIYITSSTGDSGCGLEILKRLSEESKNRVKQLNADKRDVGAYGRTPLQMNVNGKAITIETNTAGPLFRRHLMPVARDTRDIAPYASAMLDVSDGLFIDLSRICDESRTGAAVYLDKIPISGELKKASRLIGKDPVKFAVSGGEDYEILFTASDFPIKDYNNSHEVKITCIGEITAEERSVIDTSGKRATLKAEGYQHFGPPG